MTLGFCFEAIWKPHGVAEVGLILLRISGLCDRCVLRLAWPNFLGMLRVPSNIKKYMKLTKSMLRSD